MDGFIIACYNPHMKRFCAFFLLICMLVPSLCACGGREAETADALDLSQTAAGEGTPLPASEYGHSAGVKITASVAYAFDGANGPVLYGAVEYQNTGNCPVTISKASFTFHIDETEIKHEYEPPLGSYTIVLPGETSFEAAWLTEPDVAADANVTLTAELTAVESAASGISLKADHLYAADNYPGFSTLSGRLSCTSDKGCSMNIVYVGFYDAAGAFLGAWYFTKNAVLESGDQKNFVINMQDFPLSDLGARTAGFKSAAFGFNL